MYLLYRHNGVTQYFNFQVLFNIIICGLVLGFMLAGMLLYILIHSHLLQDAASFKGMENVMNFKMKWKPVSPHVTQFLAQHGWVQLSVVFILINTFYCWFLFSFVLYHLGICYQS